MVVAVAVVGVESVLPGDVVRDVVPVKVRLVLSQSWAAGGGEVTGTNCAGLAGLAPTTTTLTTITNTSGQ